MTMKNSLTVLCLFWAVLALAPFLTAKETVPILSQPELDPYGLKRGWFHQLKLLPVEGKITHTLLEGGNLFLVTGDAKLHVLNAETGQWLWTRTIGKKETPVTEPAVNSRMVAVHNNLELLVFNRQSGKQVLQLSLPEAAAAPCEMSENYIYVPLINGTIIGFVLKDVATPAPIETTVNVPEAVIADPELAKIVKQFGDAKRLLQAEVKEEGKTTEFVLDTTHRIPITCAAFGTLRNKPLLTAQLFSMKKEEESVSAHEIDPGTHQEFISWVTEQGYLYTARVTALSDREMAMFYRVDSAGQTFFLNQMRASHIDQPGNKELSVRPTHSQIVPLNELDMDETIAPDVIVTGGRASYVFAINARTGDVRWQFPAQGRLQEQIAVIGRDVYVPTANGMLHALDLNDGRQRWLAANVKRFVAASEKFVYVLDQRNRLACLNRENGARVFVYDVRQFDHCLYNIETDQIFLITNTGLIQCLRERQPELEQDVADQSETPLRHRYSCADFAAVTIGESVPPLWWIGEWETSGKKPTDEEPATEEVPEEKTQEE